MRCGSTCANGRTTVAEGVPPTCATGLLGGGIVDVPRVGFPHTCNLAKGNRTATEWGYPEVEQQARSEFKDAAAVNTTRYALVEALKTLGVPVGAWSGGRTRWNRDRLGMKKAHCFDALCVGELA